MHRDSFQLEEGLKALFKNQYICNEVYMHLYFWHERGNFSMHYKHLCASMWGRAILLGGS